MNRTRIHPASFGLRGGLSEDLQATGKLLASSFEWFGEFGDFCVHVFRAIFTAPFEGRELIR